MRRKALLAVYFAAGILESRIGPSWAEPALDPPTAEIINNKSSPPMVKAYELLKISNTYLTQGSNAHIDPQFISHLDRTAAFGLRAPHAERLWVSWANEVSSKKFLDDSPGLDKTRSGISSQNDSATDGRSDADEALRVALPYVGNSTDKFGRCILYYVALKLSTKLGDRDSMKICRDALEIAFLRCERGESSDELEFKGVVSVLKAMAYGYIPILIPDQDPTLSSWTVLSRGSLFDYSSDDFAASELLQLRAAKIADKLDVKSDIRRKAHRDLALWYECVGETEKSQREKKILFELVGITDDKILYPISVGCGNYVWWTLHPDVFGVECGMG